MCVLVIHLENSRNYLQVKRNGNITCIKMKKLGICNMLIRYVCNNNGNKWRMCFASRRIVATSVIWDPLRTNLANKYMDKQSLGICSHLSWDQGKYNFCRPKHWTPSLVMEIIAKMHSANSNWAGSKQGLQQQWHLGKRRSLATGSRHRISIHAMSFTWSIHESWILPP